MRCRMRPMATLFSLRDPTGEGAALGAAGCGAAALGAGAAAGAAAGAGAGVGAAAGAGAGDGAAAGAFCAAAPAGFSPARILTKGEPT